MYNFLFDKRSLVLLLSGLAVAGGLLFFAGLLVGVQWGLPFDDSTIRAPRPVPPRQASVAADRPCRPEPSAETVLVAPVPAPRPEPRPETFAVSPPVPQAVPAVVATTADSIADMAVPAAVTVAADASGRYSLQIGAFRRAENSEKVIQSLLSRGYEPYVIEQRGRSVLRTVRIGRYADRGEASRAADDFRRREGMEAIVRPLGS